MRTHVHKHGKQELQTQNCPVYLIDYLPIMHNCSIYIVNGEFKITFKCLSRLHAISYISCTFCFGKSCRSCSHKYTEYTILHMVTSTQKPNQVTSKGNQMIFFNKWKYILPHIRKIVMYMHTHTLHMAHIAHGTHIHICI